MSGIQLPVEFGDSINVPMLRAFCAATFRNRCKTSLWPAWSPCEKLKRATFIPASIKVPKFSSLQQAGPNVQMILVLRFPTSVLRVIVSSVMFPPCKVGMVPVLEIMLSFSFLTSGVIL